ncbi:MAG: hypothetical protein RIC55_31660 [Pirellulaceae bacterium]
MALGPGFASPGRHDPIRLVALFFAFGRAPVVTLAPQQSTAVPAALQPAASSKFSEGMKSQGMDVDCWGSQKIEHLTAAIPDRKLESSRKKRGVPAWPVW